MKRESKKKRNRLFNFPEDLLVEILLHLPFESIRTCKFVSKQRRNLIKDPNFATRYHHNGSMIVLLDTTVLYCVLISHNKKIIQINPSYTLHRIPISFNRIEWTDPISRHELLSGWSNGNMVCVKASKGFFHLYNLFTGDKRVVRNAPLRLHPDNWIYYGFGYDRYDDDYKIVLVCHYNAGDSLKSNCKGKKFDINKVQNTENTYFWVYRYKNGRWNVFDGFPYADYSWPCSSDGPCYSFNGVLHSIVVVKDERVRTPKKRAIVTYDIHTRRFGEILVPDDGMTCDKAKVTEFEGRLCYTYWLGDEWVMEVYGVGASWTKVLRIDSSVTTNHLNSFYRLEYAALYECGDGRKVGLLVNRGTLKWYHYSKNEIKCVSAYNTWRNLRKRQLAKRRRMMFSSLKFCVGRSALVRTSA